MNDREFVNRFEQGAFSREEWTHRAHVKLAYLYLCEHSFDVALQKIRTGIQALNAAHQTPETPTRGYHETTTRAFLQLIAATRSADEDTLSTASADSFCDRHPQLMTRHALRLFYSPGRLLDPRAKTEFLEPDLAPLPRIVPAGGSRSSEVP